MATRRHPAGRLRAERSDRLDALDRRIDWTDVSARATAGLTRWVLGAGMLSLHALAFVVGGLGMLLANILTDPSDITVGEPLLRWGIVLALHAAAVLIGWTIWRVVHPPAARPAYRPLPRPAIGAGRPAPVTAEPVWYPDGSANGHPNSAANGHVTHPAGAWPAPEQPRTVVTSRRVTTLFVATARDGIASARRRYRRDQRPPQPNGAQPPQPEQAQPGHGWAQPGAAPAQAPSGSLPPTSGVDPATPRTATKGSSWSAAIARDEVISVTQIGPEPTAGDVGRPTGEEQVPDPVRSWLDGYLDGQGREREARWTWVEAAASTWLARGEEAQPALPAPADPSAPDTDRPIDSDGPSTATAELRATEESSTGDAAADEPPSAARDHIIDVIPALRTPRRRARPTRRRTAPTRRPGEQPRHPRHHRRRIRDALRHRVRGIGR
jgi:hypothetical protein